MRTGTWALWYCDECPGCGGAHVVRKQVTGFRSNVGGLQLELRMDHHPDDPTCLAHSTSPPYRWVNPGHVAEDLITLMGQLDRLPLPKG